MHNKTKTNIELFDSSVGRVSAFGAKIVSEYDQEIPQSQTADNPVAPRGSATQPLENVQSAKYLGITFTENMDWGQHISDISSKATKTLGFLRRNFAFAPRSTKEVAYKTLVRPKLEYAAPIWSPYCKTQIQQVEKVQRTAARWTCRRWRNTSSVGEMLDELQWPTLEAGRDQSSLLFFHKIHCGTMSFDKDKYLTLSQSTRSTRSSHNSQYCRPQTYIVALEYSFFPRTIPHWNSLAPSVVAAETTEEFMALM